jgi:hypothetical protein
VNVQVADTVLGDSRWYPLLDTIVSLLQQPNSPHSFDVLQYSTLAKSAWLAAPDRARASTAEFIRSSARAVSWGGAGDAVTLLIDDLASQSGETDGKWRIRINPFGALTILMQPLHLIVEDESTDGAFVLWMARLLGRDTIRKSYNTGRLLFRHAGGKGQFEKSARALSFGVWPRLDRSCLCNFERLPFWTATHGFRAMHPTRK